MNVTFKLEGAEQFGAVLQSLKQHVAARIIRGALQAAAKPIWMAARQNLSAIGAHDTGLLAKSMGAVIRERRRGSGNFYAVIGARRSVRSDVGIQGRRGWRRGPIVPANYAHLVEFGTARHSLGTRVDRNRVAKFLSPDDRLLSDMRFRERFERSSLHAKRALIGALLRRKRDVLDLDLREKARRNAVRFFVVINPHGDAIHPGVRPRPFLRPAWDSKRGEAMTILAHEIRGRLAAALMKMRAGRRAA